MGKNAEHITLIDSHCHLDFKTFDTDRDQVLLNCSEKGITDIVIPGVLAQDFGQLIKLCESQAKKPTALHYALGLHPVFLDEHQEKDITLLDNTLVESKAIAVGEIGLDFFIKTLDQHQQIKLFCSQLTIAQHHDLPVILHVRKAHDETIKLLNTHKVRGGIVHAFNGSIQQAHKYIELGFKLGFGGMLTYSRSSKLHTLVKQLPLDSIVLETDSPDMTVAQHKGKRNSPEYLPYILESLVTTIQTQSQTLSHLTSKNVKDVLRLP